MRGVSVISIVRDIWEGFDFTYILSILLSVVPSLVCITLHELGHGYVAWRLGDDTAKRAGRLTLNPLKHIDTMGLLMMVIFGFGYAKPVPVDMRHFKNPKQGMAITALAGPLCNVLISLVFYFLYMWHSMLALRYFRKTRNAAYYLNPFEIEAYVHMYDLHYLERFGKKGADGWRAFAGMSLAARLRFIRQNGIG